MTLGIIFLHWVFGVILFFITNWIGKHSYSIGYMEISLFVRNEEAPALNFLIRVLTPIVYLIILSATLYYLHLDKIVNNIYLVNIYYLMFRLAFNIVTQRSNLLNWYRQFLYWIAIIVISYFIYEKLIKVRANILPDFSTIANELWIIIIIFLFQISNQIRFKQNRGQKRKENYLSNRYNHFKYVYGDLIKTNTGNEILEAVSYAILIYEDFNRPRVARWIENINFRMTKKPHTLGVMQFYSQYYISDRQSVDLGTKKIKNDFNNIADDFKKSDKKFWGEFTLYNDILSKYNGGGSYRSEVNQLTMIILNRFYKETKDTLKPS